ncbi:hypothetical protein PRUPE_2G124500 [Prunus persica]|uniref:Uncharacterized protein n=1 Tax=Prunus persica TaxID=3760 RepID=A0A251QEY8_PRUPE|nr:hypothetical protein PRUPE_2G124500 [Prunus persica]
MEIHFPYLFFPPQCIFNLKLECSMTFFYLFPTRPTLKYNGCCHENCWYFRKCSKPCWVTCIYWYSFSSYHGIFL